jgi:hypothetical protein
MSGIEPKPTEGSATSNGERSAAANARAELHGVGLFVAIAAFGLSMAALCGVIIGYVASRDQVANLKDDIIRLEGTVKDLQIQLDERK